MDSAIQEKFGIVATAYDYFESDEPTIIVDTHEHRFYVQTTDGAHDQDCWNTTEDSNGDINWEHYAEPYGDDSDDVLSTIIKVAELEAKRILKQKVVQRIVAEDEGGAIQSKASEIAAMIGGDAEDYLILANTLSRAESIDVSNTMIMLQVSLGCSQSQSNEIVRLCR